MERPGLIEHHIRSIEESALTRAWALPVWLSAAKYQTRLLV